MVEAEKPVCLDDKQHHWIVKTGNETSKGAVCKYCKQTSQK